MGYYFNPGLYNKQDNYLYCVKYILINIKNQTHNLSDNNDILAGIVIERGNRQRCFLPALAIFQALIDVLPIY